MITNKKINSILVISLFCLNIFIIVIPIQKEGFFESNEFGAELLRGFDLIGKNPEVSHVVPSLISNETFQSLHTTGGQQVSTNLDPSEQTDAMLNDSNLLSETNPNPGHFQPSFAISSFGDNKIGIYDSDWDFTDGGSSLSVNLNSSGSNLMAIAFLGLNNYDYKPLITSVTFSGEPLTLLDTSEQQDDAHNSIWYLKSPDTGSGLSFELTFNESVTYEASAWFAILDGVNLTDTFGPVAKYNSGTTDDIQLTVTTTSGDRVFGAVTGEDTGHWSVVAPPSSELYSYEGSGDDTNVAAANGNATGSSYIFRWTSPIADHAAAIGVAIHPFIDTFSPVINDFGVDDPGTGFPQFWANVTDEYSPMANVTLNLDETSYDMSWNDTSGYWYYQPPSQLNFMDNYDYQISNASDIWGNYLATGSNVRNVTLENDTVAPDVLQWTYTTSTNTFHANVSDSWGVIETVIVNVTSHSKTLPDPSTQVLNYYQDFGVNGLGYKNNTFLMDNGIINFEIIVNDSSGNEFTSSTHSGTVFINTAPITENLTLSPSPLFSNETLVLDYDYYDEDNHGESGTEIRWYKNGILQYTFYDQTKSDHESIAHTDLSPGDEWNVTVQPKDGELFGEINSSATVTVLNTPPVVQAVTLLPTTAYTTSPLSITNTTYDYENNELNYFIEWYWDSQHNTSYDNLLTITPDKTTKGESWYCQIRAFDGISNSSWRSSNSVVIQNSLPQAVNLSISPDPAYANDTLIANWDMADVDDDIENKSAAIIYWYKYGVFQPLLNNCVSINPGNTSKDQTWFFKLQVFDGTNYSAAPPAQSGTIMINNSLPIVQNVSIIPTTPLTTNDLNPDWDYLDIDDDTEGLPIIKWYTNSSGTWQQQSSYDNYDPLPANATTNEQFWFFGISVFDQDDYSNEVNSSPVLILNTPPEITNLDLTSNPTTTADLVATWGSNDNDTGDSLNFTITWYLDGALNSSWSTTATSAILEEGNTTKNDLWYFTIQAYDGEEYSSIVSLASNVTILNTIPIIDNLTLTPDPTTTDDLVANYDSVDIDSVDLPLTFIIKWYKNGLEQGFPLANETTINSGNTSKSQVWWFTVQAFDGDAYSTVEESVHREILNTAPVVSNPGLPSSPTTADDLDATWDPFDADNDGLSYNIKWLTNDSGSWQYNSTYDGYTTLPASATTKGDYWKFYIQLDDGDIDPGTRYSNEVNSSPVLVVNTPPEVTNLDLTSNPTTTADLVATWGSDDNDSDSLTFYVTWYLEGALNATFQTTDNNATLSPGNTTKSQKWTFNVTAYDGAVNSTEISLGFDVTIINSQPTITNPSFNETSPVAEDVPFNITYTYSDADGDPEVIIGKLIVYWYVDWNYNVTYQNYTEIGDVETSIGEVWSYIIQVYDGEAYSDNVSSVQGILIGSRTNDPPTAENLTITPTIPKTHQSLIAAYDYRDNDSDPQYGFEIRWYKNNSLQAEYNNSLSIPASATSKGDAWKFSVRVFDGIIWGSYYNSTPYTVGNSLPEVFNLDLTATPTTLDDLVATWESNDNDSDSLTVIVTWYVDSIENTTFANKTVIGAGNTTKGQEWNFTIQVWDGEAYSDVVSLETLVIILNTIPIIDNLTLTPDPTTTDDLVANYDSVDIDSVDLPLTFIIKWYKNGLEQGFPLANETTINSGNTSKSQVWWFTVQAFDGDAYSTVEESVHREILNTAPVVSNPGLPSSPTTADDLDATWDPFDADNDGLSYNIKWLTNDSGSWQYNSTYDGYTTLPASATTKGDYWKFYIQLDDGDIDPGTRYSNEVNSSPVLVVNTPPEVTNLDLTSNPTTTADLVATWGSDDNDSDSLTFTITWYLDGILNTSWPTTATSAILEEGNTTKDDLWYFTIKASDGENDSSVISLTSNVTILNTIPVAENLIITINPTTTNDLIADWDYYDLDNDPRDDDTAFIIWYLNGESVVGLANTSTVLSGNTTKNQVWWYTVRSYDGQSYSLLQESQHVQIQNSAPFNVSSVPLPPSPTVETGLILVESAILSSLLDADGDDIQYIESIRWFKDSTPQSDLNGSLNVPGSRLNKGETWYFTIIPSDSLDTGSLCTSANFLILNSVPTISLAYFAESDVKTTHNLTASYLYTDADGENVSISGIRWYRSTDTSTPYTYFLVPIYNGNLSLPNTATNKGERWKFYIKITDGYNESTDWVISDPIEIKNSKPWVDPFSISLTGGINTSESLFLNYSWYDDDYPIDNETGTTIVWANSDLEFDPNNLLTLSSTYTKAGQRWWVTITPNDGEEEGSPIISWYYF